MDDQGDSALVYSQGEGTAGNHDALLVRQKIHLMLVLLFGVHLGVILADLFGIVVFREEQGYGLHVLWSIAINDHRASGIMLLECFLKLMQSSFYPGASTVTDEDRNVPLRLCRCDFLIVSHAQGGSNIRV